MLGVITLHTMMAAELLLVNKELNENKTAHLKSVKFL